MDEDSMNSSFNNTNIEAVSSLIEEITKFYVNKNIQQYPSDKFYSEILKIVKQSIEPYNFNSIFDTENKLSFEELFNSIMKKNNMLRECGDTYITEIDVSKISKKICDLKSITQPVQRTHEWYIFRHNMITASNAWKALGTQSEKNQLICEKCKPLNVEKYKPSLKENPLTWGQKFEDVSIMLYEDMYKTKVYDYGCLPHPKYKFLAASPDGINDDPESPLFGRMLEIKNVVSRKITGIPKKEYWIQMQLQMEVCDLDECDFLETKFLEYEDYSSFIEDGTFTHTSSGKQKGLIVMYVHQTENIPKYHYLPLNSTQEDCEKWEQSLTELYIDQPYTWMKNIYWKLDVLSCVLVKRNKPWFESCIHTISNLWDIVEKERENGEYVKRMPKKRQTKK